MACPTNHSITMRGRWDGFGAQYAAMMSTYSWARRTGRTYCTTPWRELEHGINGSHMFRLVGGSFYGPPSSSSTTAATEKHMELSWLRISNESWHPSLRDFYFAAGPKPRLRWAAPGPHLAVHVRRGDVSYKAMPGRFVSNGLIAQCVINVTRRIRGASVHIFSEGLREDFGSLLKVPRVYFHLNWPLDLTFHHLVMADALIMAKSTMSDCAAFLNSGRVFEQPSTGGGGQLHYMHRGLRIETC